MAMAVPRTRRRRGSTGRRQDIEHAIENAIGIDDQDEDTRLHLGPARNAELLEIVTIVRDDGSELVTHALRMRRKYGQLLPGD